MNTIRQLLDVKGHDVWSIGSKAPVSEAIELMCEKEVGALLVMDGS